MGLHCSILVLGIDWQQIAAGWCSSCEYSCGVRVSIMFGKGTVADRTGVAAIRLL